MGEEAYKIKETQLSVVLPINVSVLQGYLILC